MTDKGFVKDPRIKEVRRRKSRIDSLKESIERD